MLYFRHMKRKNIFTIIISFIPVVSLAVGSVLFLEHSGKILPRWINWEKTALTWETSENTYSVKVGSKKIQAFTASDEVWSLDSEKYKIQDALIMDVDRDGKDELVVLCWRIGRYDSVPFWEEDPQVWTQHIYIYKTENSEIRPLWMASDIGPLVDSWRCDEKFLYLHSPDGSENRWIWMEWGFVLAN